MDCPNEFVNRYVITVADLPINISVVAGKAVVTVVPLRNGHQLLQLHRKCQWHAP